MPLCATETLTTGRCPFSCSYCYIPKTEHMNKIHEEIITYLKSGKYIELLKEIYGDNLEYWGLWGTEPTLTLPLISKMLPEVFEAFPKLKDISFSTAMMSDPTILVGFIKALAKTDAKVNLKVQMSLDGPSWITDRNRMPGASALIPKNFLETVKQLNRCKLNKLTVEFKWKATHSPENMEVFIGKPERVHEYIGFFEAIEWKFRRLNKNKRVRLRLKSYIPTVVVPGKYTSEDGKRFARYLKVFHEVGAETAYTLRLKRIFKNEKNLDKRHQFSCSGGDSNLGISPGRIHICHRTFYLDDEGYIESVLNADSNIGEIENWDVSLFRRGTLDFIQSKFIVPPSDLTRFRYVMRGYHDFWRFQLGYLRTMLIELALVGQVDKVYLHDEDLSILFCIFISAATSCPMENLLNTGSIHLQTASMIKFFGNGVFQEVFKELKSR